jgi:hypothetical protein
VETPVYRWLKHANAYAFDGDGDGDARLLHSSDALC